MRKDSFPYKGFFWHAELSEQGVLVVKSDGSEDDHCRGQNQVVSAFFEACRRLSVVLSGPSHSSLGHSGGFVSGKVEPAVIVGADMENNAEQFWDEFRLRDPLYSHFLSTADRVLVPVSKWEEIKRIPGFSDGPEYARDALVLFDDMGDD